MAKFAIVLVFLFASVSASCDDSAVSKEYIEIFGDFIRAEKGDKAEFSAAAVKAAGRYEKFVGDHPRSELADEAKLRIAEFYELGYQKQFAKKWLDDVIKNHPRSDYSQIEVSYEDGNYKDFILKPTKTKTAAWALYYRALWFWYPQGDFEKAERDLFRIINGYKESKEPVRLAKALLHKIGNIWEERRKIEI